MTKLGKHCIVVEKPPEYPNDVVLYFYDDFDEAVKDCWASSSSSNRSIIHTRVALKKYPNAIQMKGKYQ